MSKIFKFIVDNCDYLMAVYVAFWIVDMRRDIADIRMRTNY